MDQDQDQEQDREFERELRATYERSSRGTLVERMGIRLVEVSAHRVVATMPVLGNTQPYGLLHGGASCVLAETIGSLAAALHAGPERIAVGIDINATHHRSATSGLVTGVATMLHGGSTLSSYEIVITGERGHRVCTARLSCLLMDRVPGLGSGDAGARAPEPGVEQAGADTGDGATRPAAPDV